MVVEAGPVDAKSIGDLGCRQLLVHHDTKDPQAQLVAERGGDLDQPPWRRTGIGVERLVRDRVDEDRGPVELGRDDEWPQGDRGDERDSP